MNSGHAKETKPHILIADDDLSTRMLLRATITQWDYPIIEASDGEEAWAILQKDDSPKIATVDWMMPKIDGLSLCRLAKSLPNPPYMILLTSMAGSSNIVHALESGADDFLTKPFNYVELRSRLFVGERIINFANKLECIIKEQIPAEKLSEILCMMTETSGCIDKEWGLINQYVDNIKALPLEQQQTLHQMLEDINTQQQKLTDEIKYFETLFDNKSTKLTGQMKHKSSKSGKNT